MKQEIKTLLNNPPGIFTRLGPIMILIGLIMVFVLLNSSKISKRMHITGLIGHVTSSPAKQTQVVIAAGIKNERIKSAVPSETASISTKMQGRIDILIPGRIDSVNSQNGAIFFSFPDSIGLYKLIKSGTPVIVELKQVESSYYEILKNE